MLFVPSAREDITRYYRNSFLKFKETGDMLFYLQNVDATMISGQIEDGRDFKLYLSEDEPYEVDYILPHKSFFQYGEHACMLQRIPAKQYHRGMTGENTSITYRKPGTELAPAIAGMALDFTVLKAFVSKKKFYSLKEALKEPLSSVALSPRMMYARGSKCVHIDFHPIARVDPKNHIIYMTQPLFKQELMDFLQQTQEQHLFNFHEKA